MRGRLGASGSFLCTTLRLLPGVPPAAASAAASASYLAPGPGTMLEAHISPPHAWHQCQAHSKTLQGSPCECHDFKMCLPVTQPARCCSRRPESCKQGLQHGHTQASRRRMATCQELQNRGSLRVPCP